MFIAAGPSITTGGPLPLRRFDANLFPIWTVEETTWSTIHQVEISPVNGDIYIVGTQVISGIDRAVVVRIDDSSGAPVPVWAKYLDNGENGHVTGKISFLSSGDIAFTDGKTGITNGFGQGDAFMAVTNSNLASNCSKNHNVTFTPDTPFLEGPEIDFLDFTSLNPVSAIDYNHINWQEAGVCSNICPVTCPKSASVAGVTNPPANCETVVENINWRHRTIVMYQIFLIPYLEQR
ncbi:MAG: hypothetical protein IPN33_06410 [Saprospiraceae bacterium]|nr:hypothetical protein [Saprospiraceae bacterium]